ncbi:Zinc knuckle [Popillia japonica]|uniref:Zinc knuckle n=1 Tax=Popillia japonica TaxID=7064 RepID=A0AAW1N3B5_POPJA
MDKLRSVCIQKFDGNNFQLWKYQMEIIFAAEGLTDLVNGKTNFPAQVSEQKAWNEDNAKAMLLISTSMEFSQLQTVVACKKAAEMWDRLKTIHEQRSSVNKITLKQQFFSYKMNSTDSISQHISKIESLAQALSDVGEPVSDVDKIAKVLGKIESLAQALSDVGEPVSDVDKIAKVLGSLPPKYGAFVTAWDSYDENKQTFQNLTSRLLKEELKFSQDDDTASALAAVNINSKGAHKQSTDKAKGKANITCYYCNKKGHYKSECRKRLANQNSTTKSSTNSKSHQAKLLVLKLRT